MFLVIELPNFYVNCEQLFAPQLCGQSSQIISACSGHLLARNAPMQFNKSVAQNHVQQIANYNTYIDLHHRIIGQCLSLTPHVQVISMTQIVLDISHYSAHDRDELLNKIEHIIHQELGIDTICSTHQGLPSSVFPSNQAQFIELIPLNDELSVASMRDQLHKSSLQMQQHLLKNHLLPTRLALVFYRFHHQKVQAQLFILTFPCEEIAQLNDSFEELFEKIWTEDQRYLGTGIAMELMCCDLILQNELPQKMADYRQHLGRKALQKTQFQAANIILPQAIQQGVSESQLTTNWMDLPRVH